MKHHAVLLKQLAMNQFAKAFSHAVSLAILQVLERKTVKKPAISSACPAVIRLMQVRFPALLDQIIPLDSPMEVAAKAARLKGMELGYESHEIGTFFITPCPAKVTTIKQPFGPQSNVDGVISISNLLITVLNHASVIAVAVLLGMQGVIVTGGQGTAARYA